jgi:hypothetical protein
MILLLWVYRSCLLWYENCRLLGYEAVQFIELRHIPNDSSFQSLYRMSYAGCPRWNDISVEIRNSSDIPVTNQELTETEEKGERMKTSDSRISKSRWPWDKNHPANRPRFITIFKKLLGMFWEFKTHRKTAAAQLRIAALGLISPFQTERKPECLLVRSRQVEEVAARQTVFVLSLTQF